MVVSRDPDARAERTLPRPRAARPVRPSEPVQALPGAPPPPAPAAPPRPSRLRWLLRCEVLVGAYALLALWLSRRHGFTIEYGLALDVRYDVPFLSMMGVFLCAGLLASGARATPRPFGPQWRQRTARALADPRRIWHIARALILFKLVLVIYCCIKQAIPRIHPELYDAELRAADVAFHLGVDPVAAAVQWLSHPAVAGAIDWLYIVWYAVKVPVIALFLIVPDRRLQARFFGSYFALWMLGGLFAVALPSLGPIYVQPALFEGLAMPRAQALQAMLWEHYQAAAADPDAYRALIYEGIAAFPSLHVAAVALFACFLGELRRWLGWAMWVYVAVIQVGSVLTGWHYAIDGYAGIALAVALWALSRRLVPRADTASRGSSEGDIPEAAPAAAESAV